MPRPTLALLLVAALTTPCSGRDDDAAPPARNELLGQYLQTQHDFWLNRSPVTQAYRGIPGAGARWDRVDERWLEQGRDAAALQLVQLERLFGQVELSDADRLDLDLWRHELEQRVADHEWRAFRHPIHQLGGLHTFIPQFLASVHDITTEDDAWDYVDRLRGVWPMFREQLNVLRARQELGILPIRSGFETMIDACENVLRGAPFDGSDDDSLLRADLVAKLEATDIAPEERARILAAADEALVDSVRPAYRRTIDWLEAAMPAATDDGIWSMPGGEEAYAAALAHHTTTDLTADEIHALGLEQVARLHADLDDVAMRLGFDGTRAEFFEHLRTSPELFLPDTDEGRAEYLRRTNAVVDEMRARLPDLFATLPKAGLEVLAVEPFREASAGKAFYERGAPDGSRPGRYYVNLSDMAAMPTYQLRALAYHEAIPGHHMQISIAQELEDVAEFRRYGSSTAYIEGWALYCEELPREIGLYADPYDDAGRLAMELWRACRLVVDTGLHAKRWSRERAVEYLVETTPNPRADCERAVDRYLVMPGQATSYMIGKLRLVALRARAEQALGERFDLRAFHDVVLRHGAVPLTFLERIVDDWIAETAAG